VSKSRARRKKASLALSLPAPRNPLVAQAILRRAGSHRKSVKAARQSGRRELDKALKES
jgi:hypothetical protein